ASIPAPGKHGAINRLTQITAMKEWTNLWDFALWAYDRPGVKVALLALQDEHGDDVVTILALLAAACFRTPLDASDMVRLRDTVAGWQKTVPALRAARRAAAADGQIALKQRFLAAELAAERVALERAEPVLAPFGNRAGEGEARKAFVRHFELYRSLDAR